MTTLNETLDRISHLLWNPLRIETFAFDDDLKNSDEQRLEDVIVFDIRDATDDDLMWLLDDQFCDGIPEDLDFEEKVPFALIGALELVDGEELEIGNFDAMPQPTFMLFADIKNGSDDQVPVYKVEIDGTVLLDSLSKIADDVEDLEFLEVPA